MRERAGLTARDLRIDFADSTGTPLTALALDRLDLAPGTMLAVTGPSGSGKSTLLMVLAGLITPAAGSVNWGSTDLLALREGGRAAWRLDRVGFVFQDFHLIEELSPLGNVLLPAGFRAFRPRADLRRRAALLLDRFGVPAARRGVGDLSRGERQRVAIARALLFDPPIVLADEPTASLDEVAALMVVDTLAALAAEGRTVIAVTHDPALVTIAGEVLRLEHGARADAPEIEPVRTRGS